MEPEAALALLANDNAGDIVAWTFDGVSFGHELSLHRPGAGVLLLCQVVVEVVGFAVSNTGRTAPQGDTARALPSRAGNGCAVSHGHASS
jgi:hypothetical protein